MDLITLLPGFGGLIYTVIAFVVALLIIVFVHEYGHYIIGRWSGIRADVFSLGFGPVIFARTDRHGTRWQLAALPFGGYVKFRGDSNASSVGHADLTDLAAEERRATMHGAPLWARSATVAAGPIFNFLLAIVVFWGLFMVQGVATDTPTVGEMRVLPQVEAGGLRAGDRILAVDGRETPDFQTFLEVTSDLPDLPNLPYQVERAGETLTVQGPNPFPPVVDAVQPRSAAIEAGLAVGDVITSVDGQPIHVFDRLRELVGSSDGKPLDLGVWRDGQSLTLTLVPQREDVPLAEGGFETRWLIGVSGGLAFEPQTRTPGALEAVELSVTQSWRAVTLQLSGLWHIVAGKISSCNIGGPIAIAQTSSAAAEQGVASFVHIIAMLSIAVGLMNLFPVPVLDGGHLVFFAYEAVVGKPPTAAALRILMAVGLSAILALMAFSLSNDLFCT